jgi:hypothetical protein
MTKPVALFCNHRNTACGVQQYGQKLFKPMLKSEKYQCYYIDIETGQEFDHWANELQPNIVVYNFYSSVTMPWLTSAKIEQNRNRFKQLSIFHELDLWPMGFDALIHQNPLNTDTRYFSISRPVPDHVPIQWHCSVPVFSSFGFGLGGKGFTRIIDQVKKEYDEAIIRLNIPYAAFGDSQGTGAKSYSDACKALLEGLQGISLQVTHNLLSENELIDWLAMSTCNCFFYDANIGRGLTGTLDYALAAGKPIAITRSDQFCHMADAPIHIEDYSLHDIIARGIQPLQKYKEQWNSKAVVRDFETIFDTILGGN